MSNETYVGADIGKGYVKISYYNNEGNLVTYSSENKIARSRGTDSVSGSTLGPISIDIDGNKYIFGGIQRSPLNTSDFQMSELKLAALLAAMKKANVPPGDIILGLAMPYELYYTLDAKVDTRYVGQYANYYTKNHCGYNIIEVFAIPEAVSSFTSFLKEHNYKKKGTYIFLDIGGSSVERICFFRGDGVQILFDKSKNSLELGTSFPLETLQRKAASLTNDRIANPAILGDLLLDTKFTYNGVEYDCINEKKEVLKQYVKQLYSFLTENFIDEIKTCHVIIGGGGALLIKDYLDTWCHHQVYQNVFATSTAALNTAYRKKVKNV